MGTRGGSKGPMVIPVVEEVQAHIDEKGLAVDAVDFVDFYQSKGWVVGKGPMKDWRAACRRAQEWESNTKKFRGKTIVPAATGAKAYELEETMKHILRHSISLMGLDDMTDNQRVILREAAAVLSELAESDMPKGLMEEEFYKVHDRMMTELYNSLSEDDQMQMEAHCPSGVKFEAWAQKTLQERFSIPNPLEYEFSPQDVPV